MVAEGVPPVLPFNRDGSIRIDLKFFFFSLSIRRWYFKEYSRKRREFQVC